jgi:hypothetical protein
VNSRASNAHKDTDVPGRPSRVLIALTVSACFVVLEFDQLLERGLVLCGSVGRSSRHDACVFEEVMWCMGDVEV